jgi:hypothetical protein
MRSAMVLLCCETSRWVFLNYKQDRCVESTLGKAQQPQGGGNHGVSGITLYNRMLCYQACQCHWSQQALLGGFTSKTRQLYQTFY